MKKIAVTFLFILITGIIIVAMRAEATPASLPEPIAGGPINNDKESGQGGQGTSADVANGKADLLSHDNSTLFHFIPTVEQDQSAPPPPPGGIVRVMGMGDSLWAMWGQNAAFFQNQTRK